MGKKWRLTKRAIWKEENRAGNWIKNEDRGALFPFPVFCFSPCHLPYSTQKGPQAIYLLSLGEIKKRACRIYMILLSLHKSRFCLAVSEVKLKERFSHQKLRNFLNGYKLFLRNNEKQCLVTIFIVEKQYLVTYMYVTFALDDNLQPVQHLVKNSNENT